MKNWAHFYKIKYFKIATYDNVSVTKVVLLFTYWKKKIIFRELQLISDIKNWVWKSKNALFWWLRALSSWQIWKNILVLINVDLNMDYSISSGWCTRSKNFKTPFFWRYLKFLPFGNWYGSRTSPKIFFWKYLKKGRGKHISCTTTKIFSSIYHRIVVNMWWKFL